MSRADEETVLAAVYGDEFTREDGVWGCARLNVHCRPPDVERHCVGCELTLSVQLGKKYPYVVPTIEFRNVKGLAPKQLSDLMDQLRERANECAETGSVMMIELVQVVEDFLGSNNRNPTWSAWEEMRQREAMEIEERQRKERKREDELRQLMDTEEKTGDLFESPANTIKSIQRMEIGGEVEKELLRQVEALRQAQTLHRQQSELIEKPNFNKAVSNMEDDMNDFDEEDYGEPIEGASRYQTDFVELGVLGRGGGGEVVKVRNRLDKRIYAIKKIILESEEGKYAKFGAVQNRKLRREVTTISRMTHKNIVRYYQAWVEGATRKTDAAAWNDIEKEGEEKAESSDSSEDGENKGWWTNSPTLGSNRLSNNEKNQPAGDLSTEVDWDDESEADRESSLAKEIEPGFQSPLMTGGMGFQNELYAALFDEMKTSRAQQENESSHVDSEEEDMLWDESSVKVVTSLGQRILYIQMEYCNTTLRKVIDESIEKPVEETEKWRMIRQVVEALVYIHSRNLIHRDLKPGNVFIDGEGNVRLGDFGLATQHQSKQSDPAADEEQSSPEVSAVYSAIDDISGLLGSSLQNSGLSKTSAQEGLTGGVGTTFYRAPEQEGNVSRAKSDSKYDVKADIFSLGIVLFEMFHPPFTTYMERAEILNRLRGVGTLKQSSNEKAFNPTDNTSSWKLLAAQRFPLSFHENAPEAAQKMILWCVQRDPLRRPTSEEILSSDLLPRKMELEQHYLEEALHTLANPQSESYLQILDALFTRNTSDLAEMTYDTDIAARANNAGSVISQDGRRTSSPSEEILKAISNIRATGSMDVDSFRSIAMSASSLISATAALRRAKHAGKIGKGGKGVMKRAAQRTAGILAMIAASSTAVTGIADGIHGADPRVVEHVCSLLKSIFEAHGAVHLTSPLLRPKPNWLGGASLGPAEILNPRGTVLLLPEDLTASFARAVGRGGAATSNIKRYDIDRVYHKSLVGGHPRESLEASFDITHENTSINPVNIETEAIFVLCRAMSMIATNSPEKISSPTIDASPIWYLRLSHTRLADAILEVCEIPPKDSLRRQCLQLFSQLTAPSAVRALSVQKARNQRVRTTSVGSNSEETKTCSELLDEQISELIESGLPRTSAQRFHMFLSSGCCPLPVLVEEALDIVQRAVGNLRLLDANSNVDPRRLRKYGDISRSVKHLQDLCTTLTTVGIVPRISGNIKKHGTFVQDDSISRPLFICLDLGLRQRRKNFSNVFFQSMLITPSVFNADRSQPEKDSYVGVKVAEGGRYDDLVRKYRPPGNFGSAIFSFYTNASIPICVGVRFFIGRFVESLYLESTLALSFMSADTEGYQKFVSDAAGMETLRKSLGHPLQIAASVQVIVASANGMDAASVSERLIVASHLWAKGISAEYLTHSGVMISLLQPKSKEELTSSVSTNEHDTHSWLRFNLSDTLFLQDWSLEELCGVCGILRIPFVVIVQPHLLRDKGCVRLRRINFDSNLSGTNIPESFVKLDNLAETILSKSTEEVDTNEQSDDVHHSFESFGVPGSRQSKASHLDCIYVESDQFWGGEKQVAKSDSSNWRSIVKTLKTVSQRSESYIGTMASGEHHDRPVVIASDLPFWVLRDFGTILMHQGESAVAVLDTTEKHPKYKRTLRTLGLAVDATLKRYGFRAKHNHSQHFLLNLFLYSKMDDRFDLVTLGDPVASSSHEDEEYGSGNARHMRRHDRKSG
jgi:translation initiation factor 2-alpha kinase 4